MPEQKNVRVRFAPSPTGGLHLGGVRTALFNYLFAKKHGGKFILRIEDTDQTRFVPGAEEYIFKTLAWCGIQPDESVQHGGNFAPYRQSERKASYAQYAEKLVAMGKAYHAFDTAEELEEKRKQIPNFQYSSTTRLQLKNSLTLPADEVQKLMANGTPYVIRILLEPNEDIQFTDLIRGEVHFNTSTLDDKVLLKADGMPTYHLAVVVDDFAMQISHAFRGEEWLPSAPVHILLWKYLFGLEAMPQWAHLPLILKPDGNGKLSKRDGERLGFPVFAMDWTDPKTNETITGFKERGFLPQAFVNMLALLGWNDGTGTEIFSLPELCEKFSIERVTKSGAKFDYEKAKWFNAAYIQKTPAEILTIPIADAVAAAYPNATYSDFLKAINLVKDRCALLPEFIEQTAYLFAAPKKIEIATIQEKWTTDKNTFFDQWTDFLASTNATDAASLETAFKTLAAENNLKIGEVMLPFRIMLVGGKFGIAVFDIASFIGVEETIARIRFTLQQLA
jgi:glutamyl-tRNA synthetase